MTTITTPFGLALAPDSAPAPARTVVRPGVLPAPGPKDWVPACAVHTLVPGRGVAVLLPGGAQAALFLLPNGMIYAVDNIDPYAGAAVLSRGLTGDRAGEPTVASPLLKQVFSLRTGVALDDPKVSIPAHSVRVQDGVVHIGLRLAGTSAVR
ncbi:nitrite reductase [Intrasporangium oryzae NRRL B-24470]|uniref:Nitrite reductase n=1 Tax=Intrasporangium oryzae NRRL B-24470 TaxID=1386089 RepID=W9G4F9_9MICO|nr:nitrite reductase small subunit NirD [Intrasporangium oryzae]EWS99682.1 nitrite reductase [Intrasporangium oryzae NRRL B-24470]